MAKKKIMNAAAVVRMNIFTYFSCKLVSKPAVYPQAAGQHDIKHQTLRYIRMVAQTLSHKTVCIAVTLSLLLVCMGIQ
jgi:hypothetical protein